MRVALINLPTFSSLRPSLQLSQLKSVLISAGYTCDVYYLNLYFAQAIGQSIYEGISRCSDILLGHWLFSSTLFGSESPHSSNYLEVYLARISSELELSSQDTRHLMNELRNHMAPKFLKDHATKICSINYSCVGFTCTFSQLTSSLSFAKEIKTRNPKIITVLGGAEVEGEMGQEVARLSPQIDVISQGEGENFFISLAELLEHKKPIPKFITSNSYIDLNALPMPDHSDYYDTVSSLRVAEISENADRVPIEGSRGCWWGQKHHCTFCGLNDDGMTFRSKTSATLRKEIEVQSRNYSRYKFEFTDNILDYKYFDSLLPSLIEANTNLSFFAETKANLDFEKLFTLKRAGFDIIQPGIESLSSHVLKIMKKGTSAMQNLMLLKNAASLNIQIVWNILYGFPGERDEDYEDQIKLIPLITHLSPPVSVGKIRLDRFSPYFNEITKGQTQNFANVKPANFYNLIYPKEWDIYKLAYFFSGEARTHVQTPTYKRFEEESMRWKNLWDSEFPPRLMLKRSFETGHVIDNRSGHGNEITELDEGAFKLVKHIDKKALTLISLKNCDDLRNMDVEQILDELVDNGFVAKIDDKYISLLL